MVDEVRIAGQAPAIEHLVLVAHVHIEVLAKGFIDAEKEAVLIDSGSRTFADRYANRIQVDKNFIVADKRPVWGDGQGISQPQHLAEAHSRAVRMFDPSFFQSGAA